MSSYCDVAPGHPLHGPYHDREYGFPVTGESVLFERFVLEINQAGLSWELMLKKRANFHAAYEGYDLDRVAAYGARLKVDAVIENARRVRALRDSHGGFAAWIEAHHPRPKDDWVKLFKKTFKFTGGEITGEFLMSIGYLPEAHRPDSPVAAEIAALGPAWMRAN